MKLKLSKQQTIILVVLGVLNCLVIAGIGGIIGTQMLQAQALSNAPVNSAPRTDIPTATPSPPPEALPTWTPKPAVTEPPISDIFATTHCSVPTPEGIEVQCGFIDVPEEYNADNDKTLRLSVNVYHSTSENPASEPVIYLSGGPGGSATNPLATYSQAFILSLIQERDLIVFDQRGTGNSMPQLDCPEYMINSTSLLSNQFHHTDEEVATQINGILQCSDLLQSRNINLAAYTSAANAADINRIAEVLGYEKVDLYGVSYGTRLALTVMRDYPERVRSAVLDSALSIENNVYNEQAYKTDYALGVLFNGCAADPICNREYPNLENVYDQLIAKLDQNPVLVPAYNPLTGETDYVRVDGVELTGVMFITLQIKSIIPYLPQMLYTMNNDDYTLYGSIVASILGAYDNISLGMHISINCHEEILSTTPEQLAADHAAYPKTAAFGRAVMLNDYQNYFTLCEEWGAAPFDPREIEPLQSDIPALILAGEYDPATPPSFGRQVADNLSRSHFFEFPGYGHGTSLDGGCAFTIAQAFLNDPLATPDATCINNMRGPDFIY